MRYHCFVEIKLSHRLESDLKTSKKVATCAMTSPSSLPSRSSSLVLASDVTKGSQKNYWRSFSGISSSQIPASLCSHFYDLYDRMMFFGHFYLRETCLSGSVSLYSSLCWGPNQEESESNFIRDWRGRPKKLTA